MEQKQKIVNLLNERAQSLGTEAVSLDNVVDTISNTMPSSDISPETYLGTERGEQPTNTSNLCSNNVCTYTESKTVSQDDYALSGMWKRSPEFISLESSTGSLSYKFHAKKVHLVASALNLTTAMIYIDGKPITSHQSGRDVINGKVSIGKATLYTLVDLGDSAETHTLEVQFIGQGAQVYTLTFS